VLDFLLEQLKQTVLQTEGDQGFLGCIGPICSIDIKSNKRLRLLWENMRCLEIGLPLLHKKMGKRQLDEGVIHTMLQNFPNIIAMRAILECWSKDVHFMGPRSYSSSVVSRSENHENLVGVQ
jgi:hypothetical protein